MLATMVAGVQLVALEGRVAPALRDEAGQRGLALVPPQPGCRAALLAHVSPEGRPQDQWRSPPSLPRLVIVPGGEAMVVAALDAGADDAVTADAAPALIAARLAALIRRAPERQQLLRAGPITVDTQARRATLHGRPIGLLPQEYALLVLLAESAGRTCDRLALLRALTGLGFDPGTNVLAVHVSRLRARLVEASGKDSAAQLIETIRGQGYRLDAG